MELEWGSVADWFAAVGTVGAFAVTLGIIVKDRREKYEELARGISGWSEARDTDGRDDLGFYRRAARIDVTAHNSSMRPVTALSAMYFLKNGFGFQIPIAGSDSVRHASLIPGASVTFTGYANGAKADISSVALTFYDANGVHWTRNLETQEVLPTKRSVMLRMSDHLWWKNRHGGGR